MVFKDIRQHLEKVRIGEVLVQKGTISQSQLKQALLEQKDSSKRLGEILCQQHLISQAQLRQALNKQRWHNIAVTIILAASTLAAGLPRMLSAPTATAHHSHDDHSRPIRLPNDPNIGGVDRIDASTGSSGVAQDNAFMTAALPQNPTVQDPLRGFCHPLQGKGWLSQGIRGTTHKGRMEYAYDLGASIGTPVYAMRAGKVIGVRDKYPDIGGGRDKAHKFNYVFIRHDGGYRSVYVHLQQGFRRKTNIKSGDMVRAGQLIGYSGNSGWSTGPHLHVEVQKPGRESRFTKTVPFAIAGKCDASVVATQPHTTPTR